MSAITRRAARQNAFHEQFFFGIAFASFIHQRIDESPCARCERLTLEPLLVEGRSHSLFYRRKSGSSCSDYTSHSCWWASSLGTTISIANDRGKRSGGRLAPRASP